MTPPTLHDVLEQTGYMANRVPAPGVLLDQDARDDVGRGDFAPDASWRSRSELTVYFKDEPVPPSAETVARWRRAVWNRGFAPLLWVVSPQGIDLYNGFGRPRTTDDAATHRLDSFSLIESDLERLDAFAGRLAMETGRFWSESRARPVNRRTSVDRQLLSDLLELERTLEAAGLGRLNAQGLIGRSIFIQYLVDRDILTVELLQDICGEGRFSHILRNRSATENLFAWLQRTFNGDMFPPDNLSVPGPAYLGHVADFLEAVGPDGQTSLFPYQFDVIPVELISSIYEQFSHSFSTSGKRDVRGSGEARKPDTSRDVFYTRMSLVSLVLDEVMHGLTGSETVLDFTCGSGVFLVEALRRLVDRRSGEGPPSREMIRATLNEQIYGVDISEAAVRVAAFSLYLAALELDPDPQPPEALRFDPLIGRTLFVDDALRIGPPMGGPAAPITEGAPSTFDLIVGNPPWSYGGKGARATQPRARAPRGQSLNFAFRAMDFASERTRFGLVLSAVQFFARSNTGIAARQELIDKLSPLTLVNLSNQSSWLFPRSNLPAIVLYARHRDADRAEIETVQVPWSPAGARSHTFEIAPDDILALPTAEPSQLLKAAFFGSRRDLVLLDRLTKSHETFGEILKRLGAGLEYGLTVGDRSRDSSFLHGLPYLTKNNLMPFRVPDGLAPYDEETAERPRGRDVYRAPLLLAKEFMAADGRLVTAVSERDLVFTNAFFGAALPAGYSQIACLLAGILRSSLASWYFLMTGSTFGLSMRRVLPKDVLVIPVPDLERAERSEAGRRLVRLVSQFGQKPPEDDDPRISELDETVFDLYELDEADRIVARDGLFRATWQWEKGRVASTAPAHTDPHLHDYSRAFRMAVDVWLSAGNRRRIGAEIFDLPGDAPLRIVRFVLEDRESTAPERVVRPEGNLRTVLNRIGTQLKVELGKHLSGLRTLKLYGPDEVVIIKPSARRYWMAVSGLEDADAVIAESFSGGSA